MTAQQVWAPTSAVVSDALSLRPAPPEHLDVAFVATTQPCPWPKAYGGDLVAQALVAAMRTVEGKALHSAHSYFLRPAEIGAQIRYEVEIVRDGRGYSTRQVRAYQGGKTVYTCLAGFAAGEPGDRYAAPAGEAPRGPERVPSSADYLAGRTGGTATPESLDYWATGRGFDMRHDPGPLYLEVEGGPSPTQVVWVKPFDPLRPVEGLSDAQRDTAALAYVCDYTILEPVLRATGRAWAEPGVITASLDHAMWFHRPVVLDDWLRYEQDALAAENGRGAAVGRFVTRDGLHVATVVQEGMLRVPPRSGS